MDAYLISVLTFIGIWIILAMSLNLLVGYAGQVSIGHAAFFGIGAYTSAMATVEFGVGFPLDLILATVVGGVLGGFLGLPALRVRHDFLVLATNFGKTPSGMAAVPEPSSLVAAWLGLLGLVASRRTRTR